MIDVVFRVPSPRAHTVQVELTAELPAGAPLQDVTFPVWTPGSYLIREHERHVHDFQAFGDGGVRLGVEKTAKNVYRIQTSDTRRLTVRFEAYAHELTVRTSHVDASHAFLNPVTLVPFLPGREGEEHRLQVRDLPENWAVACALPAGEAAGSFVAKDYDELVDTPLECGPHAQEAQLTRFTVHGVEHRIVFWGPSTLDRARFTRDVERITQAQGDFFGGLPYQRYLFIAHASDSGRGGLEHRASCALLFPRSLVLKPKGYEDLLGLVSHELFHAWNVKRIKPAAFTPYDLTRENYTRLLWAFEGLTSYYEDLFLVRAGLMTRARYLDILAERMTQLERTPGRLRHPVAEASFDAWIRYYRQDENSDNSSVSYYLKGSLIGALLDLELRRRSGGQKSLDDVMRLLWKDYGQTGRGVPEDGVERACEKVLGEPLGKLFHGAVYGTKDLPLTEALLSHGVRCVRRLAVGSDDQGGPTPSGQALRCDLGLNVRGEGGRVRVSQVRRGSLAEGAGVAPGDELIAIDGLRADAGSAFQRLHERQPGDEVTLTLFRRDELFSATFAAAAPREETFTLVEDAQASAEAKALLERWAGSAAVPAT